MIGALLFLWAIGAASTFAFGYQLGRNHQIDDEISYLESRISEIEGSEDY